MYASAPTSAQTLVRSLFSILVLLSSSILSSVQIVIVDTTLTTRPTGGAQTFLVDLAAGLIQKGQSITVVTQPGPEQAIVRALAELGVNVQERLWKHHHLPEERAVRLAKFVNELRPGIYVVSISPDAGWLALPRLHPNIATMSIAHNDVDAFYMPLLHYGSFIDIAVGVSQETQRKIACQCGMPVERVRHIPYGIRPLTDGEMSRRAVRERNAPLCLGYVGRLVQQQKRIFDFVALVQELVDRGVSFELDLIGDGVDRVRLVELLQQNRVQDRVTLHGWMSSKDVQARLRQLDVFVLLSDHEGLPVALLEAMGHGLVPVVTRIPSGNSQLVHEGENGFLLPVGDIRGFADRLAFLAEHREMLRDLQQAAWNTSQNYTVERMIERYEISFQEILAKSSTRAAREQPSDSFPVMPSCRSRYPVALRKLKHRLVGLLSSQSR